MLLCADWQETPFKLGRCCRSSIGADGLIMADEDCKEQQLWPAAEMVHGRGARGGDACWMPTQQLRAAARNGTWVSFPRVLTALLMEQRVAYSDRCP